MIEDAQRRAAPTPRQVLVLLEHAGLLLDADDLLPRELTRADRDRLAPDLASLALVRGGRAAAALQARRAARVVVHGAGRVGAPLGRRCCPPRASAPSRCVDRAAGAAQRRRPYAA